MTRPLRIAHIQQGKGGGTERFFVNLVQAFAEVGAAQIVGLREGVDYAHEVAPVAKIVEGPLLRMTPRGFLARQSWHRALRRFKPDAVLGWRGPTGKVMPARADYVKLVRLGDYPSHVRHFAHLDSVVCNNPDIQRHITGLGHAGRSDVISNFARPVTPRPVSRADHKTPKDAFLICGAARFQSNKGLDTLVRAAAQLPDAWLWLVGDGPERGSLEALVAELGLQERTRFLGWVSEPMDYIAAADCFVMPSRDEPLGNALIEAWHAGTPSVTTKTEGPLWYAQHGVDCLMVDTDDATAMAAAITRIRLEPDLAETLLSGAHQRLADKFSRDSVVAQYVQLISEL